MSSTKTSALSTIIVNAAASLAAGVGAQFNLVVDGKIVGSGTAGTTETAFAFHTTLATDTTHDIQVVFTNDTVIAGQDRNLFLTSINVNGKTVSATDPLETYLTNHGTYASDGTMYWNGTANFPLPASYFPAPSVPPTPPPVSDPMPNPPSPTGFYVAVNGNDSSGNGSAASPFATLARAQVAMESSSIHTTYIESGTYNLSSSLVLTAADNNMSFIAAPDQTPVLNASSSHLINLVTLEGTKNVTLSGLTFENTTPGYSNGAVALMGATGNTIVGNLFDNNDRGVLLSGSSNNVVSGNEINNSLTAGINAGGASSNNTIDSNLINGVNIDPGFGSGTGSAGIWITGGNNNAITHNLVEHTAGAAIAVEDWDSNPADTASLNIGNTIAYNSVVGANSSSAATDSGAIYIDGQAGVNTKTLINNNLVNQASTSTTSLNVGIYLDDFTSGATATNNIVTGGDFGFLIHGGDNNTLSNNVFNDGSNSAPNIGAALLQAESGGSLATMTGDAVTKNIIYSSAAAPPSVWVSYGGAASIADNLYWNTNGLAMTGTYGDVVKDSNPQYGDPNFANVAGGNYALGSGSAASAIGFQTINQSAIGLEPSTAHWY